MTEIALKPHRLRAWIARRSRGAGQRHEHVASQRRQSLYLLVFGIARIICWTLLAACVALGLLHVGAFGWARLLAESVPFVSMISIYANWATDLDAATAAFAALVAADSHGSSIKNRQLLQDGYAGVEADVARLATMVPCQEASDLAESIRTRLRASGGAA